MRDPSPPTARRGPRIGARASITAHIGVMLLCTISILADTATTLAWILLGLNAIGAALAAVELPPNDPE